MMSLEDIEVYLPKYLSPTATENVFRGLRDFPHNIDQRLYSSLLEEERVIFQGDGIEGLPVVMLPTGRQGKAKCMVLSNTCDIDPGNERLFSSCIVYAPIIDLEKYRSALVRRGIKTAAEIDDHIVTVRKQLVTQVFFLPKGGELEADAIVFLDRLCHCRRDTISPQVVPGMRLFVLSPYGHYLFLMKLSIHFTRLTEDVDRFPQSIGS